MIEQICIHWVEAVSVDFKEAGGAAWLDFKFTDRLGKVITISAFTSKPLEISGAATLVLMAAHEATPA